MSPALSDLIGKFNQYFLNPVLAVMFAGVLLYFAIGVVVYLLGLSRGDLDARDWGRRHLIYGLVGLFVMTAAWSILKLLATVVGFSGTTTL
jgi:hypothetical protein